MTYVMSDIHGEYEKYYKMLELIGFNDEDSLYILGDVVDRGEKPMEVLLDMMEQPNVYPILGNHDALAMWLLKVVMEIEETNTFSEEDGEAIIEWCYEGGQTTMAGFRKLSREKQLDILDYLHEFQSAEVVEVGEKTFVLVHAGLGNYSPEKKLRDYTVDELCMARSDPNTEYFDDENIFTVMGHTPTLSISGKAEIYKCGRNFFIDCGACFSEGRLACLCLDNLEEFYV